MIRKLFSALSCLCALVLANGVMAGTEDVVRAKRYFDAGAQAYSVDQYLTAVQAFDEAYRLAPRSAILFSTAQALRRQFYADGDKAHLDRAIRLYRQYLAEVSQGGRRADAVQALAELEPIAARLASPDGAPPPPSDTTAAATRLMVSSPTSGARISVDGRSPSPAPFIAEVEPGKHMVKVTAEGHFDDERQVVAVKNGLLAFDVRLRERPARLRVETDEGARILVDGRDHGEAPLSRPLDLKAGKHQVVVVRSGYGGFSREVQLRRGKTSTLRVHLEQSRQRNVSLVLLGAGGVSMVVSAGFLGQSLERQDAAQSLLDKREQGNITSEELDIYDAARRDRDQLRRGAAVAAGAGALFGVIGGALYLFDTPTIPEARSPKPERGKPKPNARGPKTISALPILQPGYVGAGVGGRF